MFAEGERESGRGCGKILHNHTKYVSTIDEIRSRAYSDDCQQRHFFFCESRDVYYEYHFVEETKPWAEAQQFCKDQDWQFADFVMYSDFQITNSPVYQLRDFPVWIGLHHDGAAWSWSDGAPFENSSIFEDSAPGPGSCAAVSSLDKHHMSAHSCSEAFPFVCRSRVLLVQELLSWEQGLEVCRNMSSVGNFSLLSVEESDLQNVLSYTTGATSSKVWLGLRFLAGSWFWSDGSVVSLPSLPPCPEARLRCGALVLNTSSIEPADCSQELNVLCHRRQ